MLEAFVRFTSPRFLGPLAAVLFLLCIVGIAKSDPVVTLSPRPGQHELRDEKGVMIGQYPTKALCESAMRAAVTTPGLHKFTCKEVTYYDATGSCTPKPEVVIDPDGYTIIEAAPEPQLCPNGIEFEISGTEWVDHPFPECGKLEKVVLQACGHVAPDQITHVPGDLLDEYHAEVKPGSDPAEVCHTVDCNE